MSLEIITNYNETSVSKDPFTPCDSITVMVKKRYVDGQNGYATHSKSHSTHQKMLSVNVIVMVAESFGVNKP